jgi:uncharacterized membrane protein YfcA
MDWIYLSIVTLLAATIQSATGFGFGLIAVPVFLLILNSSDAIQITMIMVLFMSIADWMKLKGQGSRPLLIYLVVGMILGFPFGLYIFLNFELHLIKLMLAAIIIVFSGFNLYKLFNKESPTVDHSPSYARWAVTLTGYFSGILTACLAMPGPPVMLYLVHKGFEKTVIRATILTFFIFAYAGGVLLQSLTIGISSSTWMTSLTLVPVGLVGVLCGHTIAHKIDQTLFKKIVLIILMIMALVILSQL